MTWGDIKSVTHLSLCRLAMTQFTEICRITCEMDIRTHRHTIIDYILCKGHIKRSYDIITTSTYNAVPMRVITARAELRNLPFLTHACPLWQLIATEGFLRKKGNCEQNLCLWEMRTISYVEKEVPQWKE